MAEVPKPIAELIAKFDQNLHAYHTAAYDETEVRVEFINPFFEALGWDVTNKAGIAKSASCHTLRHSFATHTYLKMATTSARFRNCSGTPT